MCDLYLFFTDYISLFILPFSPAYFINFYIRYGTRCSSSQSRIGAHTAINALAIHQKKLGEGAGDAPAAAKEPLIRIRTPQLGACSMKNIPHGLFVSGLKIGVSQCLFINFLPSQRKKLELKMKYEFCPYLRIAAQFILTTFSLLIFKFWLSRHEITNCSLPPIFHYEHSYLPANAFSSVPQFLTSIMPIYSYRSRILLKSSSTGNGEHQSLLH